MATKVVALISEAECQELESFLADRIYGSTRRRRGILTGSSWQVALRRRGQSHRRLRWPHGGLLPCLPRMGSRAASRQGPGQSSSASRRKGGLSTRLLASSSHNAQLSSTGVLEASWLRAKVRDRRSAQRSFQHLIRQGPSRREWHLTLPSSVNLGSHGPEPGHASSA